MKTTTLEAAAPSIDVKQDAFVGYENANAQERRKRAEVIFGSVARNLSDEDLAKYAAAGIDMDTEYKKKEAAVLAATEKQLALMDAVTTSLDALPIVDKHERKVGSTPADSADFNGDVIDAQIQVKNAVAPLRAGVMKRLGLSLPKGGLVNNAFAFAASLRERRALNRQSKLDKMPITDQREFLEKWKVKQERRHKIGMGALGLVLTAYTFKTGAEGLASIFDTPSSVGGFAGALPLDSDNDKQRSAEYNVVLMNDEEKLNPLDEAYYKLYNTSDSSFLDYDNKEYRGDFGPALKASEKDGDMPAGFADWMERMKHEPNGVANLVSGLGMDNHDGSMTDRNALADFLDSDSRESRIAHARYGFAIETILTDSDRYSVELIDLKSYDTTYMYDDNGNLVIGKKDGLDLGGTAYEIIDKKTGEKTYWRTNCGGFQQVWPKEEAPVAPAPVVPEKVITTTVYAPEGGPKPTPKPERPTTTVVTTPPRTTETPPPPTTTVTPPPTTQTPPPTTETTTPPAPKGNAYGDNGSFDPNHQSGDLIEPVEVEEEEVTTPERTIPGGAANDPIVDRPEVRDQGDETGGRDTTADANTQDTSKNGNEGSGEGDSSGTTRSGEAESK